MAQERNMTRREAREAIVSTLFSYEYTPEKTAEELNAERIGVLGGKEDLYISEAIEGVLANLSEIDGLIERSAVGWALGRISRVSRAILRLACYEMLYRPDIPPLVSLDEAVELAKKFDDENAYTFVNGVLNRAMQSEEVARSRGGEKG
ncbi:MAG: transcription antitermination factor NusB [Clostridia bacterium]|nr:transcription antitermination factor NusB [Clostridia bacterium]